eukprot:771080-Rhodomonas_salina.4
MPLSSSSRVRIQRQHVSEITARKANPICNTTQSAQRMSRSIWSCERFSSSCFVRALCAAESAPIATS